MPKTETIIGLSLLAMMVAFLFPAVMTAAEDGRTTATETFNESDVTTVQNALVVETTDINPNGVTVNLTSVQSEESTQFDLTPSETHTATLDGSEVNVTAVDLTSSQAVLRVDYPTTFGWSDGPRRFSEHLPIVIMTVGFVAIVLVIARVIG